MELGGLRAWTRALRLKHWVKNALVLLPALFHGTFFAAFQMVPELVAFLSFCLMSSAIYVLNDLRDLEADRAHPTKRLRPLASGEVSARAAAGVAMACAVSSVVLCILFAHDLPASLALLLSYGAMNVAYSLRLRDVQVLDVLVVAMGFFLRVVFGGAFLAIGVSSWLLLTTVSLSLWLALTKRLGELRTRGDEARKTVRTYPESYLTQMASMFMGCGLVFYSLWIVERLAVRGGLRSSSASSSRLRLASVTT